MTPRPENGRKRSSGATSAPTRPYARRSPQRPARCDRCSLLPQITLSYCQAYRDSEDALYRMTRIALWRTAELRIARSERDALRASLIAERAMYREATA